MYLLDGIPTEGSPPGPKMNWLTVLSNTTTDDKNGCWIWNGRCRSGQMGYGAVSFGGRTNRVNFTVHRLSWMTFRGPIPTDLHVLHKCDVPLCVNPDHLFLGTAGDNIRDAVAKGRQRNQNTGRTRCRNGHLLSGDNLRVDTTGFRRCKICRREYERQWKKNRKDQRDA